MDANESSGITDAQIKKLFCSIRNAFQCAESSIREVFPDRRLAHCMACGANCAVLVHHLPDGWCAKSVSIDDGLSMPYEFCPQCEPHVINAKDIGKIVKSKKSGYISDHDCFTGLVREPRRSEIRKLRRS